MTLDRARMLAMIALRLALGATYLNHSVYMIVSGVTGGSEDHIAGFHLMLAGIFETLAALLFLIPRTVQVGAVLLCLNLGIAFIIHAFRLGEALDMLVVLTGIVAVALDDRARRRSPPTSG